MRVPSLFCAALTALLFASCGQAKPTLTDAINVEVREVPLREWSVGEGASQFERSEERWARHRALREGTKQLINERERQLGIEGAEWITLIEGIKPGQPSWWVDGRITPEKSVYIAQIEAPEYFGRERSSVDVCIITFDPTMMPKGVEMRHYRLLFTVLVESGCGTAALDLSSGTLRGDLTREITPQPHQAYAKRKFEHGTEVTVLMKEYERGDRAEVEGMIANHLGFIRPAQSQIGTDRGFYVAPDGGVAVFRTVFDSSVHAVCVIRNADWPEAMQGHMFSKTPPSENAPAYRQFCAEQLIRAESEYSEAQRKDWEDEDSPPPTVVPLP